MMNVSNNEISKQKIPIENFFEVFPKKTIFFKNVKKTKKRKKNSKQKILIVLGTSQREKLGADDGLPIADDENNNKGQPRVEEMQRPSTAKSNATDHGISRSQANQDDDVLFNDLGGAFDDGMNGPRDAKMA